MARKEDYWTSEQEDYLAENWGVVNISTLSHHLGKPKNALILKKYRMGLGAFLESGDYVSLNILMQAMMNGSRSHGYKIISWVKKRGLPVHTKRVDKNAFRVVKISEFWEWANNNRSFVDFSKLEENLLGEEPAWVKEQRKLDATENRMHKVNPWTYEDDSMLRSMLQKNCYTYSDIAKRLRRSEGAIVRRISSLGCKERPLREPPHSPWQDWQRQMLPELIMKGMGYGMMAEKLQKTEKAIRGYVGRMYGTEVLDKVRERLEAGEAYQTPKRLHWTPEQKKKLEELIIGGVEDFETLAREIHRPAGAVTAYLGRTYGTVLIARAREKLVGGGK